jgi:hypothetical protein
MLDSGEVKDDKRPVDVPDPARVLVADLSLPFPILRIDDLKKLLCSEPEPWRLLIRARLVSSKGAPT